MPIAPALVVAPLLLLAGCGQAEVSTDDLEKEVSAQLEQEVGTAPTSVSCDEALPAEKDAKVRCVLTAPDDTQIGLTVTTTSVDGDNVKFAVVVDKEPMG